MCTAAAFMRWFKKGEDGERPSLAAAHSDRSSAAAIIVRPNGSAEFHDKCGWHPIETTTFAFGTGEVAALVAMRMGADARQAVKIAAEFDVWTGPEVDSISLGAQLAR
jgi:hypothetical protein